MSILQLMTQACTITRRSSTGAPDERGNPTVEESSFDTVCEIQQERRSQVTEQGVIAVTDWRCFLPAGTDIAPGDELYTPDDGLTYAVDGEPWHVRNPRAQAASHIEATLVRTRGLDRSEAGS